ncbi:MAG: hypothetical protein SGJ20_19430 [Planctomycetota bacterium]|nr:hypothetical protein [Planctomycetota bacterium]
MAKSVIGIANDYAHAERIVGVLRHAGFSHSDISVLLADPGSNREFAMANATKAPEGATVGGGTGAVLGGALGWLAGIGALAIPGVGPLIAAGPIMAALSGAALGGALGSISGGLIGLGIPEFEANLYEGRVKEGGALIAIHAEDSDQVDRAKKLLEAANAEDITTTSESDVNRPR